ncbi:MAG: methyl-accepting chemotaxis protein [Candidatus Loosdrechtia sp.]|uniref:methyl-accepting chemotaxis protein n=1 Tax=Candidatus Loosdrechtia sp. TaxID=3101272 RepID=UPI003A5EFFF3|nr:MAG: methyl-accepting chemotaxis protein [Candidatus Jettenia sp. AMX2]
MSDIYWNLVIPLAIIFIFNFSLFVLTKTKVIQRLKLTRNLIVTLVVITLIPILSIGFVNYRRISSILSDDAFDRVRSIGKTHTILLNDKLKNIKTDAEIIAQHWIIKEILRQTSVERADREDPGFKTLFKNVQGHLDRIASVNEYIDIMLVSANGNIELTSTAHTKKIGMDISTEYYFQSGKERTHFTGVFYDKLSGKNLMYLITPCFDSQGRFIGCVIVKLKIKRIYDGLFDHEDLGNLGEAYLVNQERLMISESRSQEDAILKVKVDTHGVNEGLAGKSGAAVYRDYRDIPVIGSWHPVKYTNWILLVEIDKKEAFAPLRANQINQSILISATIVLVVLIAVFSARSTIKPVQELIEVSRHVREGKLDREVKEQCYGEIGILINSFNDMLRSMKSLAKQADAACKGDLTISMDAKGELANAFNSLLEHLRLFIKQTQESVVHISSASVEIMSNSEEQSGSSAELSASVSEITATMEELSASAKQIAFNAESVAKIAEDSRTTSLQGMESVSTSIHVMEEIKNVTENNANKIAFLCERAQKVGDIVGIIKEIASETHLLALNAAIEASAAREFGKRFGVVAAEVRRLAERTKASAEETNAIVIEIQAATNAAVLTTEQSVKRVERGVEIVRNAVQSFETILTLTKQTADASEQIVVATHQQDRATEQAALTLREISGVVKHMAEGLKQLTAAIAELNKLTINSNNILQKFKI